MRSKWILALAAAAALSGCGKSTPAVNVFSAPCADGKEHSEPVFYNGKFYLVSYRFEQAALAYGLTVQGKDGRRLKPSDAPAADQLAVPSLSHFACPSKQRAAVLPGSLKHEANGFTMKARCGG